MHEVPMHFKQFFLIGSLISNFFFLQNTYACSSCGSSATSPLVLYPGENFKYYLGINENFNFKNYGGDFHHPNYNNGILNKETLTLAVGYRTTENSFVTLTGSFIRNEGPKNSADFNAGTEEHYLIGDPIISGRYTLVNMEISETYKPQVQIIASYKPSIAKNMLDTSYNDANSINSTGNGYHQISGGIDLWWGMPFIEFGGSQFITYSFDRHPDTKSTITKSNVTSNFTLEKATRELQYTTVLTVGHTFTENHVMLQGGLVLDYIGHEDVIYDILNERNSPPQQSNSLFATLNWNLTKQDFMRFSYSYGGALPFQIGPFTNKFQTTSNSVLVAYERTIF
jgi:hypothetical protein